MPFTITKSELILGQFMLYDYIETIFIILWRLLIICNFFINI